MLLRYCASARLRFTPKLSFKQFFYIAKGVCAIYNCNPITGADAVDVYRALLSSLMYAHNQFPFALFYYSKSTYHEEKGMSEGGAPPRVVNT